MQDVIPIDPRDVDSRDTLEFLQNYENDIVNSDNQDDINEIYPVLKFLNDMQLSPLEIRDISNPENRGKLNELLGRFDYKLPQLPALQDLGGPHSGRITDQDEPAERFTSNYNTPEKFRSGWESRDTFQDDDDEDFPESRVYSDEGDINDIDETREYGSGQNSYSGQDYLTSEAEASTDSQIFRELSRQIQNGRKQIQPAVYSEGGVVWSEPIENLKGTTQEEVNPLLSLDKFLFNYNLGFKRPERLDVKKPGPPFDAQITDAVLKGK